MLLLEYGLYPKSFLTYDLKQMKVWYSGKQVYLKSLGNFFVWSFLIDKILNNFLSFLVKEISWFWLLLSPSYANIITSQKEEVQKEENTTKNYVALIFSPFLRFQSFGLIPSVGIALQGEKISHLGTFRFSLLNATPPLNLWVPLGLKTHLLVQRTLVSYYGWNQVWMHL